MYLPAAASVIAAAILDWMAVACSWQRLKYITKPLVMVVLLLWLSLADGWRWPLLAFTLGALFSLAGDTWLMLPGRFFIHGLIFFLVAHCCYIIGFTRDGLPLSPIYLSTAIITITTAVFFARMIRQGVNQKTGTSRLRKAATVYSVVVTAMFLSAVSVLFKPGWERPASLMSAAGGLLFYFSDCLLAYDRFVNAVKYGRLLVRITYHTGQALLLWGAVLMLAS